MNRFVRVVASGTVAGFLALQGLGADRTAAPSDEIQILKRTSKAFSEVAKKAMPAVVFIHVEKNVEAAGPGPGQLNDPFGFFGDDFFERFFRDRGAAPRRFRQMGEGSGFLISKDGFILTNNHVVGDADKIMVKLHDGREVEAKKIGSDPKSEVAVIKIEGKDLPYLELGDSAAMDIGEWVIAVGNPFGLTETLTVGVVSAKGRSNIGIAEYEDFIQTDAAINPGNSGGPLLDIDGRAIGINTAIFSRSGGYMGIGFAIPINMAKGIKDQLMKSGKVVRGFMGVQLNRDDIDEEMATSFGLKKAGGVLVAQVVKDAPADKAGLKAGDIILEIDGKEVADNKAFRNTVAMLAPDTKATLSIWRDQKRKTVDVTVGNFPDSGEVASKGSDISGTLGFTVQNLTPDIAKRFGYDPDEGVLVSGVEQGSAAQEGGIQPGNLILSVNHKAVRNVSDFQKAIAESSKTKRALLRIRNPDFAWYALLRLP